MIQRNKRQSKKKPVARTGLIKLIMHYFLASSADAAAAVSSPLAPRGIAAVAIVGFSLA
jgi:hypothetical protein